MRARRHLHELKRAIRRDTGPGFALQQRRCPREQPGEPVDVCSDHYDPWPSLPLAKAAKGVHETESVTRPRNADAPSSTPSALLELEMEGDEDGRHER